MSGKTIKLYLVDGTPTGTKTAEIMNWSGKVIVAPRSDLSKLGQREEARRTGTYLLVGPDPEVGLKPRVYVGESDNVLARLINHDKDPENDFFTQVVLLISKDANLTKAHARYLENRLILLAKASGRAVLANGNDGSPVSLPESDVADMESFLEHVQMVLPVLGFDFTQPKVDVAAAVASQVVGAVSPVFVFATGGAHAKARELSGQFVLLKGSTTRVYGGDSWTSYKILRDQLVSDGKLAKTSDNTNMLVAAEDIVFSSPSAAASVVAAHNMNGRQAWKVEGTGQTYQDWEESRLPSAGSTLTGDDS